MAAPAQINPTLKKQAGTAVKALDTDRTHTTKSFGLNKLLKQSNARIVHSKQVVKQADPQERKMVDATFDNTMKKLNGLLSEKSEVYSKTMQDFQQFKTDLDGLGLDKRAVAKIAKHSQVALGSPLSTSELQQPAATGQTAKAPASSTPKPSPPTVMPNIASPTEVQRLVANAVHDEFVHMKASQTAEAAFRRRRRLRHPRQRRWRLPRLR